MLSTNRNQVESGLWRRIDSGLSQFDQFETLSVLADFYEECGNGQSADYLRLVSSPRSSDDKIEAFIHSIEPSFRQLIKRLNEPSARLFACACAEQVTRNNKLFSHAIQTTRLYLFGLATDRELEAVSDSVWRCWVDKMEGFNSDPRRVAWAAARACGVSSRVRDGDVFTDALYAATNSRSYKGLDSKVGWTKLQQMKSCDRIPFFQPSD